MAIIIIIVIILIIFIRWLDLSFEDNSDTYEKSHYKDKHGYLRNSEGRLIHRDVAWKYLPHRTDIKFSLCEVHHKDHNKINNDPSNLEILTPMEHAKKHCEFIHDYIFLTSSENIIFETEKAVRIGTEYIPKSLCIFNEGKVYVKYWFYHKTFR